MKNDKQTVLNRLRRRTLSAGERQNNRDCAEGRKQARVREQETMSPEAIDENLIKAIIDAVVRNGAVTRQDLLATNVPPAAVDARFKHCMAIAEEREPRLRHMMREMA